MVVDSVGAEEVVGVVVAWVGGPLHGASQVFEAPADRLGRVAHGVGMVEVGPSCSRSVV